MKLTEAAMLALDEMDRWNLDDWCFGWDNAKRRFGRCNYQRREITLSRTLVALNDEAQVTDTIRHEIAHALAGYEAGHGPLWRAFAVKVGANPKRCYEAAAVVTPVAPWLLLCDTCGQTYERHRRTKTKAACRVCCDRYAGGRFDARYEMRWVRNSVQRPV